MAKEICISTTPHETRLAILEDDQLAEVYYERENEYTLAGSVYKGRVTRVLPGMQSSFVEIGLERDAFLYVTDFLEDSEDQDEYETSSVGARRNAAPAQPEEEAAGEERKGRREGRRGEGRRTERGGEPQPARPQAAEERAAATAALRTAQPTPEQAEEKGDEETPQGTRRWRGRRGRRRGGVRAGGLGATPAGAGPEEIEDDLSQPATAPFDLPERGAPGGLAAPLELRSDPEETPELFDLSASAARVESAPAPRPTITLPGESLSKYGGTPAPSSPAKPAAPSRPVNYTAPKPSTLVEVNVEGWTGGSVLPGESLSRYREAEPTRRPEPSMEIAPEESSPKMAEAAPLDAEQQDAVDTALASASQVAPETVSEALPGEKHAETLVTTTEPIDEEAQTTRAVLESEGLAAPAPEDPLDEEYEPRDGAASVRMSPPTTSELRLSQLFGIGERETATTRSTTGAGTEESEASFDASVGALAAEPESGGEEGETSLGSTPVAAGDWTPESASVAEPAPQEAIDQTLEGAGVPAAGDRFADLVDQLHGFAPGSGLLEEEVIDEAEYDFDPVHAHHDEHDLEDLEEETLDGDAGHAASMEPEEDLTVRMQEAAEQEVRAGGNDAFALEEVGEDDEEEEPSAAAGGEPRTRERTEGDRARRGDRNGGRRRGVGGGGGRRQSAQTQDLPIISDLLKQGQEILVQIAKEPIAKKGARITSHIALPGRFLVFMPTVSHVGVSRKIASDEERQRLKRVLIHEKGESSGGFIVRTAAEGASEEELRADLRFLISLWTEIKQRADTAKAPALIYHDLNLVERILRDQVSSNFSTIWVDTEQEYERIVRFLNRFQPELVRRVKLYTKETPLFEHFGIQEEISKALKSKVWLKSGGSIVINQTEALVAIDINTGKYVGKTARLEDTIVKTNLDAIPEIVRQIRLRDLGGIIVIDFIDMDERKNRHRVLQALEEAMKVDRAPSKVLQFNDFGLVAITRKRVKQSLERTLSVQCEVCAGTGMVKSPVTVCNEIYIELRKMQRHLEGKDVLLRVNPEVVKQLKGGSGRWITEYEEMIGKTIIIKSDPSLHPEQFDIQ